MFHVLKEDSRLETLPPVYARSSGSEGETISMRTRYNFLNSEGYVRCAGKLLVAPLCLMVLGLVAAPGQAQTIVNFDDLSSDGTVADGYGGINWGGVWNAYSESQSPYTAHSDFYRVYTPGTGSGEYTFTFLTPQVFDGAWFAGYDFATLYFNLYDASNNLLATSGSLSPNGTPAFLASGYSGLVSKVGVYSNSNDFYIMDDVTYGTGISTTAATPEPGSIALLLGAGVTGAGFLLRRRK